jgi:hypothetical protein
MAFYWQGICSNRGFCYGGVGKALLRALHFARSVLHICFSEHSRAPRWKLQMRGVNLLLENEGLVLHCFHLLYCSETSRLGSQVASADPSSSSSRPLDVR